VLLSGCNGLFYYPEKGLTGTPELIGIPFREVTFQSGREKLHGWLLPATEPKGIEPKEICLLFLHGNAGNLFHHLGGVYWLPSKGFPVFMFDYRGYGLSTGNASYRGLREDAHSALRFIKSDPECREKGIVILGQSLGGTVSIELAATSLEKDLILGMVIDSAFSSYRRMVKEKVSEMPVLKYFKFPVSFLVSDRYSPERYIKRVGPVPIIFIHGKNDRVVPFSHSETLYDLAPEPKGFWKLENAGHIGGLSDLELREELVKWLDQLRP